MGTTLENLHILDGDEEQIKLLLPDICVGKWSERFISLYPQELEFDGRLAKILSKKQPQPVLTVWLLDSDAVGFTVYQNGKRITEHIMDPEDTDKMGNIALFCESLGLPEEDISRLRNVWKKGDAEEQLNLTALLLGLPLYNDYRELPEEPCFRDSKKVDKWIEERPTLSKIKRKTKAVLVQELSNFRYMSVWDHAGGSGVYCSVEPYDNDYTPAKVQLWKTNEEGILQPIKSFDGTHNFQIIQDRIIGTKSVSDIITYDSADLLPIGHELKGTSYFLSDGGLLVQGFSANSGGETVTFTCCAPDGSELWQKSRNDGVDGVFACDNNEIIVACETDKTLWLERVDAINGATIQKMPRPFGINAYDKVFRNGYWWVAHGGQLLSDGKWSERKETLTKFNSEFQPIVELSLPTSTQDLFFSPDNAYLYIFFLKSQVMVVNTETLTVENILDDKSFLMPVGFDLKERFWLQRNSSTVEAWDTRLSSVVSRHKLKGEVVGFHKDANHTLYITTDSKERALRVYRIE